MGPFWKLDRIPEMIAITVLNRSCFGALATWTWLFSGVVEGGPTLRNEYDLRQRIHHLHSFNKDYFNQLVRLENGQ